MILQEIGQANDTPDDIIFDHFQEAAFPDQPIGRPVLGAEDGIKSMPRATLMGYMKRHYAHSNCVIAAAGNLRHDDILDLVGRHFTDLPVDAPPSIQSARTAAGNSARTATWIRSTSCLASRPSASAIPTITRPCCCRPCWACGGMSSRLFQEVREKRGLVYSIYSSARPIWMAACSASMPAPAKARPRN